MTSLRKSIETWLAVAALVFPGAAAANLIEWETHFTDEIAIADGVSIVAGDGVGVTLQWNVFSDNDGGTFDLTPHTSGVDYVTSEHDSLGNHAGFIELGLDNENDDPADYVELTLSFSVPVIGLQFSVLDVDSGGGNAWDDGLILSYNGGTNIRTDFALFTLPSELQPAVSLDNEPGYEGFEGWNGRNATNFQTRGNIGVDFAGVAISDVTFRYFSTDDAQANPAGQRIGIADLLWSIPEPSTGLLLATGLLALGLRRR
jgi:hypothetical protein